MASEAVHLRPARATRRRYQSKDIGGTWEGVRAYCGKFAAPRIVTRIDDVRQLRSHQFGAGGFCPACAAEVPRAN